MLISPVNPSSPRYVKMGLSMLAKGGLRAFSQRFRSDDDGVCAFHRQALRLSNVGLAMPSTRRQGCLAPPLFPPCVVELTVKPFVEDVINDFGLFEVGLVRKHVLEVGWDEAGHPSCAVDDVGCPTQFPNGFQHTRTKKRLRSSLSSKNLSSAS